MICRGCGATSGLGKHPGSAVKVWNRRAPAPEPADGLHEALFGRPPAGDFPSGYTKPSVFE